MWAQLVTGLDGQWLSFSSVLMSGYRACIPWGASRAHQAYRCFKKMVSSTQPVLGTRTRTTFLITQVFIQYQEMVR